MTEEVSSNLDYVRAMAGILTLVMVPHAEEDDAVPMAMECMVKTGLFYGIESETAAKIIMDHVENLRARRTTNAEVERWANSLPVRLKEMLFAIYAEYCAHVYDGAYQEHNYSVFAKLAQLLGLSDERAGQIAEVFKLRYQPIS